VRQRCFAIQQLIIMVKEPRLGAVKTRLAGEIGAPAAARFYRTVSTNLIRRLSTDSRWRLVLAVAPDRAVASSAWPPPADRMPQGHGDIGERMLRLLLASGAARTILIGSDIPGVCAEHIAAAFKTLGRSDIVFGPAEDGGFWLVGIRRGRCPAGLFRDVHWSSPHTLADTLRTIRASKVALAATLSDVDDAAAYANAANAGRCVTPLRGRDGRLIPSRENPAR
jgi:rSAM/selenodomain-associated transferase 1